MGRILIISAFFLSLNLNASEKKENSVTLFNANQNSIEIYVNGTEHSINANSSLRVPCLPEEIITAEKDMVSNELLCGETLELAQ